MLPWGTLQRRTLTGESTIHLRVAPGWQVRHTVRDTVGDTVRDTVGDAL
jgi:hypothetical protein